MLLVVSVLNSQFWEHLGREDGRGHGDDVLEWGLNVWGGRGPVSSVTWQVGKEPFVGTGKSSTVRWDESPLFSCSVVSNSFWPHGLQHTRLPCPSPTPGAYSKSCPLCRWCHPTISSSVAPFSSSHLQSLPASGSFSMSWFFASGVHCWWVPNEVWDVSWRQGNQRTVF